MHGFILLIALYYIKNNQESLLEMIVDHYIKDHQNDSSEDFQKRLSDDLNFITPIKSPKQLYSYDEEAFDFMNHNLGKYIIFLNEKIQNKKNVKQK